MFAENESRCAAAEESKDPQSGVSDMHNVS